MIRYVLLKDGAIEVEEILFQFSDCNAKTSDENANMIIELLEIHEIPSEHYIVQGYDIGCNISGKYNGAQAKILEQSHSAVFSPCGFHTLNLCGADAAEFIPYAVTFFGTL